MSAVKRDEFSEKMANMILRSHWCDITVLNVHAPTKDTI
jgi:hypothetical protein